MEYLEYAEEDEDDNLFGSDKEDNATAGPSSLPTFNPAKPLSSAAQSLVGPSAGSGTLKERAHARDPQDRLDELRFMRMYKSPPHTGKGARSLKHITQDGKFTVAPHIDMRLTKQCLRAMLRVFGTLGRWSTGLSRLW
jgi:hypothetical protein